MYEGLEHFSGPVSIWNLDPREQPSITGWDVNGERVDSPCIAWREHIAVGGEDQAYLFVIFD